MGSMTRTRTTALGLALGFTLAAACDEEPPPNHCVEFLSCYGDCRKLPEAQSTDLLDTESPEAMEHATCFNICGGWDLPFPETRSHMLYPLFNKLSIWNWISDCIEGKEG